MRRPEIEVAIFRSQVRCPNHYSAELPKLQQFKLQRVNGKVYVYSDSSFAIQGPSVWNSLPAKPRAPDIQKYRGVYPPKTMALFAPPPPILTSFLHFSATPTPANNFWTF